MFGFLRKLFGAVDEETRVHLRDAGTIIDVRTPAEFAQGHIDGAINIALDQVDLHLEDIRKMRPPIVTVCRSGRRSGIAAEKLNHHGIESYNGGGWKAAKQVLES